MRVVPICLTLLASACSPSSQGEPPSTAPVDPNVDLVMVPEAGCEAYAGWYAFSERGLKTVLEHQVDTKKDCEERAARSETAAKLADAQRRAALEALAKAQFWQRYGPLIIMGASGAALVAGGIIGFEVGRITHYRPVRLRIEPMRRRYRVPAH